MTQKKFWAMTGSGHDPKFFLVFSKTQNMIVYTTVGNICNILEENFNGQTISQTIIIANNTTNNNNEWALLK
jgi:hypothetical protein